MNLNPVFIVEAKRTPQAKAGMELKDVQAPYLGHYLIRHIMDKLGLPNDVIDEVIFGCVGNPVDYPNIARVIGLEAGLHKKVPGCSVHRNCAAGMEALAQASIRIAAQRDHLIFAGGVESMSNIPLLFNKKMTKLFTDLFKAKTPAQKLSAMLTFRPSFLVPIVAIQKALTDPFANVNMGMTAEILARDFGITRMEQDEFANRSHHRAAQATQNGRFKDEIVPLIYGKKLDHILYEDKGFRADSTVEGLGKMKPFFDKKAGTVTVGNACPITDGGSCLLLASEEALKKYNLEPLAKIINWHFHGLEPERMGAGPILAMDGAFKRSGLKLSDMDLFEINEAFSAQVITVLRGMKEKKVADFFGIDTVWGEINEEILNPNGGGIALGHPVGSTGSRIIVTLLHELMKRKGRYGMASLCIGGGQGGAMIIENLKR
ncbi:MAG: acetyl-CoA acyltransferase [Bdellovibrionales bacterium RIFOXYB1_FULL_37_110]|nr:MAG: acetyl-CoA acyltransferase [Bdellovibrionales bacterium RIFOXYA1_FULL_38_20]OFZ51024.1 MAG: acetyl-CoA acyltransferase [Bdellovibrionales bacterium RIFOXYC1_FULL_37_79]OFZ60236.1 MAG: acetyl-CoA acyltransferase [Bdellovibrionales bacterium RIFOXYB1_FULL_37_110]OFZ63231.1 MAG: acetyl-CoA acyltransferase [Bdellovibrionales bacterium RIFOXYD1_FULL_36_51]